MNVDPSRASVLVVEDDPDYCQLLREAFLDAGFRTIVASNGEKALDILRTEPVDLVVSDFIMPELNGLELCRLLGQQAQAAKPKVILYSCNTDVTFRNRARELGAIDYLSKSDDTDSMVEQICDLTGFSGAADVDQRLRTITRSAGQLKVLVDSLLDFARILTLAEEPTPAAKLAWESMQRTGGDIRRLLTEIDSAAGPTTQGQTSGALSH